MTSDSSNIAFIVAIILTGIFAIRMLINLYGNNLSLKAKIIWLVVIICTFPAGAMIYFITEDEAKF